LESRLPDVLAVVVLELADELHGAVVHEPHRTRTVRSTKRMLQVDEVIPGDRRSRDLDALLGPTHDARRLAISVADDHRALLRATESPTEDTGHVALDLEEAILHQLLGNLRDPREL